MTRIVPSRIHPAFARVPPNPPTTASATTPTDAARNATAIQTSPMLKAAVAGSPCPNGTVARYRVSCGARLA